MLTTATTSILCPTTVLAENTYLQELAIVSVACSLGSSYVELEREQVPKIS